MARSNVHDSKRKKNLAVLALVLGWCVLIFLISIARMARAEEGVAAPPDNPAGAFAERRTEYRAQADGTAARFEEAGKVRELTRGEAEVTRDAARAQHAADIEAATAAQHDGWRARAGEREAAMAARDQARAAHRDGLTARPGDWWRKRLNP